MSDYHFWWWQRGSTPQWVARLDTKVVGTLTQRHRGFELYLKPSNTKSYLEGISDVAEAQAAAKLLILLSLKQTGSEETNHGT